jgi:hypothetical protein
MDDGWHYGPDGTSERGFLEGTAFQPDDTRDHMDAWGSVHPDNLKDCAQCRAENILNL